MYNYSDLWNDILDKLELEFDIDTFNEVFKPCVAYELRNGYIVVKKESYTK